MTALPLWQTWLFFCVVAFSVTAITMLGPLDLKTQVLLLAPLVAVFGLPHGALDLPIAEVLFPLDTWLRKALFVAVYLGLAGVVLGLWLLFPSTVLTIFLFYSALHFSGDWANAASLQRWTGGAATVGAPALFRREDVAHIFGFLVPPTTASLVASGLAIIGGTTLVIFIISLLRWPALRKQVMLEQIILWAAAALLAPITYFIVYFCALHSVRHSILAIGWFRERARALCIAGVVTSVTVLAALAGFLYLQQMDGGLFEGAVLKVVFIGLAALTVPHMILMNRFNVFENVGHRRPLNGLPTL